MITISRFFHEISQGDTFVYISVQAVVLSSVVMQ